MNEPLVVELPGNPPRALSPNGRAGWAEKHRHAQQWRASGRYGAMAALDYRADGEMLRLALRAASIIDVAIVIGLRKGGREQDADNALASLKAGLDGIAEGVGCDDRVFRFAPIEQRRAGGSEGYVRVKLQAGEEES